MTGLRIVPSVATEEMWLTAWKAYHPWRENAPSPDERPNNFQRMKADWGDIYNAMLAACRFPQEGAELDDLCVKYSATMPGRCDQPASWWACDNGAWLMPGVDGDRERATDRNRMRAFILALTNGA